MRDSRVTGANSPRNQRHFRPVPFRSAEGPKRSRTGPNCLPLPRDKRLNLTPKPQIARRQPAPASNIGSALCDLHSKLHFQHHFFRKSRVFHAEHFNLTSSTQSPAPQSSPPSRPGPPARHAHSFYRAELRSAAIRNHAATNPSQGLGLCPVLYSTARIQVENPPAQTRPSSVTGSPGTPC